MFNIPSWLISSQLQGSFPFVIFGPQLNNLQSSIITIALVFKFSIIAVSSSYRGQSLFPRPVFPALQCPSKNNIALLVIDKHISFNSGRKGEKDLFYWSMDGQMKVKTYTDWGLLESEIIFVNKWYDSGWFTSY